MALDVTDRKAVSSRPPKKTRSGCEPEFRVYGPVARALFENARTQGVGEEPRPCPKTCKRPEAQGSSARGVRKRRLARLAGEANTQKPIPSFRERLRHSMGSGLVGPSQERDRASAPDSHVLTVPSAKKPAEVEAFGKRHVGMDGCEERPEPRRPDQHCEGQTPRALPGSPGFRPGSRIRLARTIAGSGTSRTALTRERPTDAAMHDLRPGTPGRHTDPIADHARAIQQAKTRKGEMARRDGLKRASPQIASP